MTTVTNKLIQDYPPENPIEVIREILRPYLDCGDSRFAPEWAVRVALALDVFANSRMSYNLCVAIEACEKLAKRYDDAEAQQSGSTLGELKSSTLRVTAEELRALLLDTLGMYDNLKEQESKS